MNNTVNNLDWSDRTILIAEDTDDNFAVLTALLKKTNIVILRARNGIEAIDMVGANPAIDAILMDISMPDMDGIEATRIIKREFPEKIVIAQTAHAMLSQKEKIEQEGCNDYLLKPIRKNILLETLSKYLI